MKARLINKLLPHEQVEFDFNPDTLKYDRVNPQKNMGKGSGGGSTPSIFRGGQPKTLSGDAWFDGDDVQDRADQLYTWMDPGGGLLGKAIGAALGAVTGGRINLAAKTPTLMFVWGSQLMECTLIKCSVKFVRFDDTGEPIRAKVNFTVRDEPSLLGLLPTNPSSGGLPGRQRHIVSAGENLAGIAVGAYGDPRAWRAVASANAVDDPLRMRPGDVVYLPNLSELSSFQER